MEQNDKMVAIDTFKNELISLNSQFALLIKQTGKFNELKEIRERMRGLEIMIKKFEQAH